MQVLVHSVLYVSKTVWYLWEFPGLVHESVSVLQIAEKKFVQGWTTMELMALAGSDAEKRRVAMVALLELDEPERYLHTRPADREEVRRCHKLIRKYLAYRPAKLNMSY